ncbi:MAG: hypothetical protein JWN82_217 [Candidatus Saccharibacteria bacterium]|nr:hypothetical protein [Candidatus Saccharibacteria bacterium]
MSEYPATAAYRTPTVFSGDLETPFWDMGMADWSTNERKDFFANTELVLDIGSGFEGIARSIHALFEDDSEKPKVINLNPQFADWAYNSSNVKEYKASRYSIGY